MSANQGLVYIEITRNAKSNKVTPSPFQVFPLIELQCLPGCPFPAHHLIFVPMIMMMRHREGINGPFTK